MQQGETLMQSINQPINCYYGLCLLALALLCWLPSNANAILAANCTASMNPSTIIISSAVTPSNADNATISATITYTCTNTDYLLNMNVSVCLSADGGNDGSGNSSTVLPRYMKNTLNDSRLAFTMTLPSRGNKVWGTDSSAMYQSAVHTLSPRASISVNVPVTITLLPNNNNALAAIGSYINTFNSTNTAITYSDRTSLVAALLATPNCQTDKIILLADTVTKLLPFTVQATVIPSCVINAVTDLNLGTHPASQTLIAASNNTINTTCTTNAPYYIGLLPSNGNINGAGVLTGTGSNTEQIPYQLRSAVGATGAIWGNTATATTVGNGLAQTGSGVAQTQTVYITVPNSDVTPDNYTDKVTVTVHY